MSDSVVQVEVTSEAALWAWLEAHHGQDESVWLVTYKAADAARYVGREAVLDALVAYGWVDGRRKVLDGRRTQQLISPRRTQYWAKSYKDRAQRLEEEGRMRPAGRASVAQGKASGLWSFMDDVEALVVPEDLQAALEAVEAANWFGTAAPSYRRNVLRWIKLAKSQSTRAKRIDQVARQAALGEKVPQL
ncbi:MAG: YdeI/OmpD-associated family protein [Pseudomonadota bacterium]